LEYIYSVTFLECDNRRGMDWTTGLTDTLYTQFGTSRNYSAIAALRTSQFTVTHTRTHTSVLKSSLVVSWQRIYNAQCHCSRHELIPFLSSLFNHSTAISRHSLNSSDNSSLSKLLYDWWFTANQFCLGVKPLATHDKRFVVFLN
jgi:hypothetical protein